MTRHRLTVTLGGLAMAAALVAGCDNSPTGSAPPPQYAVGTTVILVWPPSADLAPGEMQSFTAYACPPDVDGNPLVGPDGVPGTSDDDCVPVPAAWSVIGSIGNVAPTTGTATSLTASLPAGSTEETGSVRATVGTNLFADANVRVASPQPQSALVVHPSFVELTDGDMQQLTAWNCPRGVDGNPDVGPDGVPGTADDDCVPANVDWSVSGDIGSLSATTGPSTTLTAALPDGSVEEQGEVGATLEEQLAEAGVLVTGSDGGEPVGEKMPCVTFTENGTNRKTTLVVGKGPAKVETTASEHCIEIKTIDIFFDKGMGLAATFSGGMIEKGKKVTATNEKANGIRIRIEGERISKVQWIQGSALPPVKDATGTKVPEIERVDLEFPPKSEGHITGATRQFPSAGIFVLPMKGKKNPKPIINDAHVYFPGK